jgi:hypothetical protein
MTVSALIADLILATHFLFVAFIIVGQVWIVIGYFRSLPLVRNRIFRISHLIGITVVVIESWANQLCPLTLWENKFRGAAGEQVYTGTFVQHWVGRIVYYDAPQWVFTMAYTLFGAVVLISWFKIRPVKKCLPDVSKTDTTQNTNNIS